MIQGKSHHAESCAKTRKSSAAQNRIQGKTTVALFNQTGDTGKTTVAVDPVGGWRRQRSRVIVIDAGRKGRNENSWLDWSKQRAKEGLTRLFHVAGLTPPAPRRDALEIACAVDHIVTGGPPRFAVRTRSALLATDVALTRFQPSPSEEGASVEIRKLLEKARIFRPGPHPRLILNRYGPCVLTVRERATALANQDPPTPCGRVSQRVAFANVASSSQFAWKPRRDGHARRQMIALATEIMSVEPRGLATANAYLPYARAIARPEAATRRTAPSRAPRKAERFTARMTIGVAPGLRVLIKVSAVQHELMVTETPRNLRAREFPQRQGGRFDGRSHRG